MCVALPRATEVREILSMPADYRGECDGCHDSPVPLWIDQDVEPEAEWAYCRRCWKRRARKGGAK